MSRYSIILAAGMAFPAIAAADTLTFDDVADAVAGDSSLVPVSVFMPSETAIANGYGGLNWENFWVVNSRSALTQHTGYGKGTVYGDHVAYNHEAGPASVSSDSPFTFNSVYLTAAWNDGLNIQIDGYSGSELKYSKTVVVNTGGPSLFQFDWEGISGVRFTSSGGTNAGLSGWGEQLAMDGFTFNEVVAAPVPLPLGVWGGLAMMGAIWAHRIRRRAA